MQTMVRMNGIFDAKHFDIKSSHVGDTFRIFVDKPATIQPGKTYPAIYTLDGNASFTSVTGTQRLLTIGGEVPASFIIGIGYLGETLNDAMVKRNRGSMPRLILEKLRRGLWAPPPPQEERHSCDLSVRN